jgi:hypothetical protein
LGWEIYTDQTRRLIIWDPCFATSIYRPSFDRQILRVYQSSASIDGTELLLDAVFQIICREEIRIRYFKIRINPRIRTINIEDDSLSDYLDLYGNQLSAVHKADDYLLLGTVRGQLVLTKLGQILRIFEFSCQVTRLRW